MRLAKRIACAMGEDDSNLFLFNGFCIPFNKFGLQFRTAATRSRVRARYGLPEAPCGDVLFHTCCQECAIFQEFKELEARGLLEEHAQKGIAAAVAAGVLSSTAPAQQTM